MQTEAADLDNQGKAKIQGGTVIDRSGTVKRVQSLAKARVVNLLFAPLLLGLFYQWAGYTVLSGVLYGIGILCAESLIRRYGKAPWVQLCSVLFDHIFIGYCIYHSNSWDLYPLYLLPMSTAARALPWGGALGVGLIAFLSEIILIRVNPDHQLWLHLIFFFLYISVIDTFAGRERRANWAKREIAAVLQDIRLAHRHLEEHNRWLTLQAQTDPMTGLYNFRHFEQMLQQYYALAHRYRSPLSLIMLDVDFFKKLNDTYGHAMGDKVLRTIAHQIRDNARNDDLVCRYGGEEFAILLPRTGLKQAGELAERIRASIEEYYRLYAEEEGLATPVTVSLGVSSFPERASSPKDLRKQADAALYLAKERGRNRVVIDDGRSSRIEAE